MKKATKTACRSLPIVAVKRQQAVALLAEGVGWKDVCRRLGVSERTLRNYRADPDVQRALRSAARERLAGLRDQSLQAGRGALDSLQRVMKGKDTKPSTKVMASRAIIATAVKLTPTDEAEADAATADAAAEKRQTEARCISNAAMEHGVRDQFLWAASMYLSEWHAGFSQAISKLGGISHVAQLPPREAEEKKAQAAAEATAYARGVLSAHGEPTGKDSWTVNGIVWDERLAEGYGIIIKRKRELEAAKSSHATLTHLKDDPLLAAIELRLVAEGKLPALTATDGTVPGKENVTVTDKQGGVHP